MRCDILAFQYPRPAYSIMDSFGQRRIERIRHADMAHHAVFEKRPRPHLSRELPRQLHGQCTASFLLSLLHGSPSPLHMIPNPIHLSLSQQSTKTHPLSPIHHPPRHQKIPRPHLLPQTPHRAEPHRGLDPQLLQRRHVRPVRYLVRRILVVRAVAGEEGYDRRLRWR